MEININSDSIGSAEASLKRLGEQAYSVLENAHQATLNGSFSGVSGLNQLGSGHGGVLNGGPGSAMSVLRSYVEQIDWLREALAASHAAVTGQNMFAARGMDIADEGGAVGTDSISFPQRPMPRFENFSFTPPVVTPALSIDQLANDFSTTNIGATSAAGIAWETMSTGIASVAEGLATVAGQLSASNSGEVVDAAVQKISEVAGAGGTFAANSAVMAKSVQQLAAIKSHGNMQVIAARTALAAIPDPVQRKAAEQAFLVSFPATFTPSVVTGIPPIRNLMSLEGSVDGGGEIALGMTEVDGDGPADVSGLSPSGPGAAANALNSVRTLMTAGQFGAVNQELGELGTVGANAAELEALATADHLNTSAASLGTPVAGASPISGLNPIGSPSGLGGTGGIGAPATMGPVGAIPGGTPALRGGAAEVGRPGPLGTVGGGATGISGGGRAPSVRPAGGVPAMPGAGGGVPPGGLPGPMGAGMPIGGMGAPMMGGGTGGPHGAGGAGPASGTSPRLAGMTGSHGAGVPGMGGGTEPHPSRSTTTGGAGAKSTAGPRAMMPMMGAPMAGAAGGHDKPTKVKTVTSAVEEDGNIAALLGDRGPVVPGVIGAWARG